MLINNKNDIKLNKNLLKNNKKCVKFQNNNILVSFFDELGVYLENFLLKSDKDPQGK
jgi:hypothetical protein